MISTVTIRRDTTAHVAVEHPDDWSDAELQQAVANRQIDVAARAEMWSGDATTRLGAVEPGVDWRDELDDKRDFKPGTIELTAADLDAPAFDGGEDE